MSREKPLETLKRELWLDRRLSEHGVPSINDATTTSETRRARARDGEPQQEDGADQAADHPTLTVGHSLGFRAEIIGRDIAISQGAGKAAMTVWLSIGEFTELVRFVQRATSEQSEPSTISEATP